MIFDRCNSSSGNPIGISNEFGGHRENLFDISGGSWGHQDDAFEFFLGHIGELIDSFSVFEDFVVSVDFFNVGVEDGLSVRFFDFRSILSSVGGFEVRELVV